MMLAWLPARDYNVCVKSLAPDLSISSWILIHSRKGYGGKNQYETPMKQLADVYEPNLVWHWKRSQPLKSDERPRKILLSWDKEVFGEATATITRKVDPDCRDDYNCAFILTDYRLLKKPVPFRLLKLGNRESNHRDLIVLYQQNLSAYNRLAILSKTKFSANPDIIAANEAIDLIINPGAARKAKGQAFFQNVVMKKCIELHGMDVAKKYLTKNGFNATDVSDKQSFDYLASKDGKTRVVEVKSTTGGGNEILLTKNEVQLHQARHPANMLLVVHSIRLDSSGKKPKASGGTIVCHSPWSISQKRLKPLSYSYSI